MVLLAVLLAVSVAAFVLWPTDEDRIRGLVKEGARAVEAEDLDALMSKISFSYSDRHGLSYLIIKKQMQERFKRFSDIIVQYEGLEVIVAEDDTARAAMDLRVIATMGPDRGYFVGDIKEPVRLELWLRRGGSVKRWLVVNSTGYWGGY